MVYFLTKGRVNYVVGTQEITFKTFVAGSYFGELEVFRSIPRLFAVRCEEDSELLSIEKEYFLNLLEIYPTVY